MLEIEPNNFHWLDNTNSEFDLCVHGGFILSFDNKIIIDASNENLTLSAAALFMLRTIERDHSFGNKICEHLIPECADMVLNSSGVLEFIVCPFGIDWWVEHSNEKVTLVLQDGKEITTTLKDYIQAVLGFVNKIKSFYNKSETKKFSNEMDKKAFDAFNIEWASRVKNAMTLVNL